MSRRIAATLSGFALLAALSLPAYSQTVNSNPNAANNTATPPQNAPQAGGAVANNSSATSPDSLPPLQPNTKQGFWGHLNPFARKKYVNNQTAPIRDRVNELDELSQTNDKNLSDLDSRSKAAIADQAERARQAQSQADAAQQQVQQTSTQADQLNQQVGGIQTRVSDIDQYQIAQTAQVRMTATTGKMSTDSQQQLDTLLQGLDSQKGYMVEVVAYTNTGKGTVETRGEQLADSVVRYMVLHENIPLYRIHSMNSDVADANASSSGTAVTPDTVEVRILRNDSQGGTGQSQ